MELRTQEKRTFQAEYTAGNSATVDSIQSRKQLLRLARSNPNILQSNSYLSSLSKIDLLNLLNGV